MALPSGKYRILTVAERLAVGLDTGSQTGIVHVLPEGTVPPVVFSKTSARSTPKLITYKFTIQDVGNGHNITLGSNSAASVGGQVQVIAPGPGGATVWQVENRVSHHGNNVYT